MFGTLWEPHTSSRSGSDFIFLSTAFSDHGPEVLVHARGVSGGREGILLLCECTVLMDARLGVASEQSRGTQGLRMQQPSVGGRAARQL